MTIEEARKAYFRHVEGSLLKDAISAESGCAEIDVLGVRLGGHASDPAFKSGYLRFETGRFDGKAGFVPVPPTAYYSDRQIEYPKPAGLLTYNNRATYVFYTPITRRVWAVRQADFIARRIHPEAHVRGMREHLADAMRESLRGRPVDVSTRFTVYAELYLIETTAVYRPLAPKGVSI